MTTTTRGTTNKNVNGSSNDRRHRREWLVDAYRADVDVFVDNPNFTAPVGAAENFEFLWLTAWLCYRCGTLLTVDTVTVDRIVPGALGCTYGRNNIRPACGPCNSTTGGAVRGKAA